MKLFRFSLKNNNSVNFDIMVEATISGEILLIRSKYIYINKSLGACVACMTQGDSLNSRSSRCCWSLANIISITITGPQLQTLRTPICLGCAVTKVKGHPFQIYCYSCERGNLIIRRESVHIFGFTGKNEYPPAEVNRDRTVYTLHLKLI